MNKTLYFIRHAQAEHNPDVDKYGKDILTDWKYFDAKLTEYGKEQREGLLKKDELKEGELEKVLEEEKEENKD